MADIGVVHMDLTSKGGGEAVSMNVLEALEDDHDVTLLTLTEPDFDALNAYFNTAVDSVTVRQAGRLAPAINDRYGLKYYVLQNALLGRYARRCADEFDLLVSTINELGLGPNAVQYVHFPFDWSVNLENREHIFHPTVEEDSLYERVATRLGGIDVESLTGNVLFANSEWTADAVEEAYGVRPRILHPPVDTSEFEPRPWDDREDGIVTIGRIERSKRICELIEITDGVRERGRDIHLHVVGPTVDEEYRREVKAMAADRDYVFLEGEVPRSRLVELACSHRYGIHGKQYEHFGMAVAELVAAGAVTFVPETGGQHAVVRDRPELLYGSLEEAIESISRVMDEPALQRDLRMSTTEIRRRFGRRRFKQQFRSIVDEVLASPTPTPARRPVGVTAEDASKMD
ncbi:glycosyltransferase family 4 protein [Natrinema sp. 74]|uniref:glycosyltransferase family 4 protein n=1 Tax=Natrinema sp. 74 TaxID=3384159 RepID=UPI0038D37D60